MSRLTFGSCDHVGAVQSDSSSVHSTPVVTCPHKPVGNFLEKITIKGLSRESERNVLVTHLAEWRCAQVQTWFRSHKKKKANEEILQSLNST